MRSGGVKSESGFKTYSIRKFTLILYLKLITEPLILDFFHLPLRNFEFILRDTMVRDILLLKLFKYTLSCLGKREKSGELEAFRHDIEWLLHGLGAKSGSVCSNLGVNKHFVFCLLC
jgi:hypothetical protein